MEIDPSQLQDPANNPYLVTGAAYTRNDVLAEVQDNQGNFGLLSIYTCALLGFNSLPPIGTSLNFSQA